MAAKNKFLNAMKMPSIDDMFSSEADRQRESGDCQNTGRKISVKSRRETYF